MAENEDEGLTSESLHTGYTGKRKSSYPVPPPADQGNLNAYPERFVRSIKESCLNRQSGFGHTGSNWLSTP